MRKLVLISKILWVAIVTIQAKKLVYTKTPNQNMFTVSKPDCAQRLLPRRQVEAEVPCTGVLEFSYVAGQTKVNKCQATYPLRFITPLADVVEPSPEDRHGVWVYMLGFGGGLLAGDKVGVQCIVRASCKALVTTQASTKVYKQVRDKAMTVQGMDATVEPGALLVYCPEAITLYASALYSQVQNFHISKNASIVVVDSVTSGRISRGESWNFELYSSVNRVFIDDQLVYTDSQRIDQSSTMGPAHAISTLFLYGLQLEPVLARLRDEEKNARFKRTLKNECYVTHPTTGRREFFVVSWSEQDCGAIVLRIASSNTELLRNYIRDLLEPLNCMFGGPVIENF